MICQFEWLLLPLMLLASGVFLGFSAYYAGLAVKRWAFVGALLGPIACPLFTTHKHLAHRKVEGAESHRLSL